MNLIPAKYVKRVACLGNRSASLFRDIYSTPQFQSG